MNFKKKGRTADARCFSGGLNEQSPLRGLKDQDLFPQKSISWQGKAVEVTLSW
jgi:hypothetical protein